MKIAFLFPGQGAQSVGMGKDLYDEYKEVKRVYEEVNKITGIDIGKISFEGPEEALNETKYTQLAILTHSLAILEILKAENIKADVSAGLSLGEYTALIYSHSLPFEQGIKLVQKRGEYMQSLSPKGNWKMSAILGLTDAQVEDICKQVKSGFVVPANYNSKGQVVISGEEQAVLEAQEKAMEAGAKKVALLKTSGPFHTEKLIESSKALRKELENINFGNFETEVIKNIDGEAYKNSDNIKEILANHIISPVRFSKTIENMLLKDVDTFIEVGPGKTLSGFVKRTPTEKEIKILNINNINTLQETINFIKEN